MRSLADSDDARWPTPLEIGLRLLTNVPGDEMDLQQCQLGVFLDLPTAVLTVRNWISWSGDRAAEIYILLSLGPWKAVVLRDSQLQSHC